MTENPSLSIVCPVYNKAPYLPRCLDSVIAQTFEDFELILVDDGSEDSSLSICREYEKKDGRIRVIHIENAGPSHARNVGIDATKGKYIGFVDSDDYIAPELFETLVSMSEKYDVDISICDIKRVTPDGKKIIQASISIPCGRVLKKTDIHEEILRPSFEGAVVNGLSSVYNKIFKKDLVVNNNIRFDESRIRAEDGSFNMDAMLVAESVIATDKKLYYYVDNPGDHLMARFQDDQFELWCRDREQTRKRAAELGFSYDESRAAGSLINSTILYLRWEYEAHPERAYKRMVQVFESEAFSEAMTYPNVEKEFIKQTKMIWKLNSKRMFRCCKLFFCIWNYLRPKK